jgi:hypothetical protein
MAAKKNSKYKKNSKNISPRSGTRVPVPDNVNPNPSPYNFVKIQINLRKKLNI